MSKPKNHHYVSQCHQKEFFDESTKLIYLYDKELDNFYSKQSTKNLFSKEHLNSRQSVNGFDQETLEKELKVLFEDGFHKHVSQINEFLTNQDKMQDTYESLCWLTILGILGEVRHPYYKRKIDEIMIEMESELLTRYYNLSKEKVKSYLRSQIKTPYENVISYIEIAIRILKKLEPLDFSIFSIESDDLFILPDTSSFQLRGQLKKYSNKDVNEIIQVGVPITKKLYILGTPQSFKSGMHSIVREQNNNSDMVYQMNKDLYLFSKKTVACSNELYLKKFIEKIKIGI
jgi:hypothetical protein